MVSAGVSGWDKIQYLLRHSTILVPYLMSCIVWLKSFWRFGLKLCDEREVTLISFFLHDQCLDPPRAKLKGYPILTAIKLKKAADKKRRKKENWIHVISWCISGMRLEVEVIRGRPCNVQGSFYSLDTCESRCSKNQCSMVYMRMATIQRCRECQLGSKP